MLVVIIVIAIVVIVALFLVLSYNSLVKLRNQIDNAWTQIDVQLKRRHDLVPNLVETVKGYASHERQTLEAVIAARGNALNAQGPAQQGQAENMLSGALKSLFAVSEAYPQLKADTSFLNLQEELTSTEDRIAYARQFYNDAVLAYDNRVESFPGVLFAQMFTFEKREYFEGDPAAAEPVRVDFSEPSPPGDPA